MIHNFLKPCCNDCESIDIKADTSRGTDCNASGYLERRCDTVICCGHEYVCKRYIECKEEPNKI